MSLVSVKGRGRKPLYRREERPFFLAQSNSLPCNKTTRCTARNLHRIVHAHLFARKLSCTWQRNIERERKFASAQCALANSPPPITSLWLRQRQRQLVLKFVRAHAQFELEIALATGEQANERNGAKRTERTNEMVCLANRIKGLS